MKQRGEPLAEPKWFAVHTRASQEKIARKNLQRAGYMVFMPFDRVRTVRPARGYKHLSEDRGNIVKWIERPHYSRYLFVALRFTDETLDPITHEMDGISTVVRSPFTGAPLQIPGPVMDALMAAADEAGEVRSIDEVSRKRYERGQKVKFVEDHACAGLIAEIALDAGRELRLIIEMFGAPREVSARPEEVAAVA